MQHLYAAVSIAYSARPDSPVSACQPFGAAEIEKLRTAGMPFEVVEGEVAARVLADLRRRVEIDADPTALAIVFAYEGAGIGLIIGETLCALVSGPERETRDMLRRARGQRPCCVARMSGRQARSRVRAQCFQFWSPPRKLPAAMEHALMIRNQANGRESPGADPLMTASGERLDLPAIAQRLRDLAEQSERMRLSSARNPQVIREEMREWRANLRDVTRQLAGK